MAKEIKRSTLIGYLTIFCCFLALSPEAEASKKGRGLTKDEVSTTWIGLSSGGSVAYRFDLRANGKGQGASVSAGRGPVVFSIATWSYRRGKLKIVSEAVPVGDLTYAPVFTGEVVGTKMELVERGDDWKIELELRREPEMLDLLSRLQKAMAETDARPGAR